MDTAEYLFLLAASILAWGSTSNWRPRSTLSALILVGCWITTIVAALVALLAYAEALARPR